MSVSRAGLICSWGSGSTGKVDLLIGSLSFIIPGFINTYIRAGNVAVTVSVNRRLKNVRRNSCLRELPVLLRTRALILQDLRMDVIARIVLMRYLGSVRLAALR